MVGYGRARVISGQRCQTVKGQQCRSTIDLIDKIDVIWCMTLFYNCYLARSEFLFR